MKSISFYEKQYQKEMELAEKHKKNAADIRKTIDAVKGKLTISAMNALNLNSAEYNQLMKFLKQDKKTICEALDLVVGKEPQEGKNNGEEDEKVE